MNKSEIESIESLPAGVSIRVELFTPSISKVCNHSCTWTTATDINSYNKSLDLLSQLEETRIFVSDCVNEFISMADKGELTRLTEKKLAPVEDESALNDINDDDVKDYVGRFQIVENIPKHQLD